MLMQAIEEPHAAQLPPQAEKLLTAMKGRGTVWLSRSEIADLMSKKRLNPGEIALLDMLAVMGEIERQRANDETPIGYHWEYRAKE